MTSTTLGPYELLEKVGEGGMGAVYRARDTRLGRAVAIKILVSAAGLDRSSRQRLMAEARAASALEHPNIVTIHDVGEADGTPYLVMEHVGGGTLAQIVAAGPLPPARALDVARALASALECAHAAGIVHRDLKPSNVMLTADGRAKLVDFGIAKALLVPPPAGDATLTAAPATAPATRLGTPGYMAPEQAAGRPADARADVFAFGVLLFEMLTGRRAFARETPTASLAALLRDDLPAPGSLVPGIPPALDQVVALCTRKEPERRIAHMADVRLMLDDAAAGMTLVRPRPARVPRRTWIAVASAAALVSLAAAAAAGYAWLRKTPDPPLIERPLVAERLTLDRGITGTPAISPDGRMIAFASDRSGRGDLDLYVQQVATQQALRLTDDPLNDWQPAFSPDGTRIAFRSERDGGGLYVMDALGGPARLLASGGSFPRWSPDGTRISYVDLLEYRGFGRSMMYVVPAAGGTPQRLVPGYHSIDPPFTPGPVWSPDGTTVVFSGAKDGGGPADWWLAAVDGGTPRPLAARARLKPGVGPFAPWDWTRSGLLCAGGTTMGGTSMIRVRLDPRRGTFVLPAERLVRDSMVVLHPQAAQNGLLVFQVLQASSEFLSVDLDAASGRPTGPGAIVPGEAATRFGLALSRDGRRIAYLIVLGGSDRPVELRVRDLATGRTAVAAPRVSTDFALPRFTPDGQGLAYRDRQGKDYAGLLVPAEGGAPAREVCKDCVLQDFFADGRSVILFERPNRIVRRWFDGRADELIFTFADPHDLAAGDIGETMLSWDDRLLAVELGHADGSAEIRVVRLGPTTKTERDSLFVARDARLACSPRWSADGRFLYFLSAQDGFVCVWARRIDPATGTPRGDAFPVLHRHDALASFGVVPRYLRTFDVARGRLVLPVMTGNSNVWKARLPE